MVDTECPECHIVVDDHAFECDSCSRLYHYRCTKLSVYFIILYRKSARKYICELCTHNKFDEISKTITDHGAKMNFPIGEQRTIPTDVTEKGVPTDTNSTIVMHETEN